MNVNIVHIELNGGKLERKRSTGSGKNLLLQNQHHYQSMNPYYHQNYPGASREKH